MESRKNLTRAKILNSAYDCIVQYGYSKTTFKDIARNAAMSRSLIYLYFKNKNDLFATMNEERHDDYMKQSEQVLASNLSKKEKLSRVFDIWIIDPYRVIVKSPQPNAWLDGLKSIAANEMRFRKLFIQSVKPLLGDDVAKVVVLAFRGLLDDRPKVHILKKRTNILIDILDRKLDSNHFVKP